MWPLGPIKCDAGPRQQVNQEETVSASKQGSFFRRSTQSPDRVEWKAKIPTHLTKQVSNLLDRSSSKSVADRLLRKQTPETVIGQHRGNKWNDQIGLVYDGGWNLEKILFYWCLREKDDFQQGWILIWVLKIQEKNWRINRVEEQCHSGNTRKSLESWIIASNNKGKVPKVNRLDKGTLQNENWPSRKALAIVWNL